MDTQSNDVGGCEKMMGCRYVCLHHSPLLAEPCRKCPRRKKQEGLKKFLVRGVCLVPTEVQLEVNAVDAESAVKVALSLNWKSLIGSNDGDSGAAFDWQPTATEVLG